MILRSITSATLHRRLTTVASTAFSISDTDLTNRGFILHRNASSLDLTHLNSIFVAVGFPHRDPSKVCLALDHSDALLCLHHSNSDRPVAFARATGEGIFNAIIWDVVVDPPFQGIGLGKAVMVQLVDDLLRKGITDIALYSEPRFLGFYRLLGFISDPAGIRSMAYYR